MRSHYGDWKYSYNVSLRGPGDKTALGVNETAADAGNRGPTKANLVPADEIKKFLLKSFPADAKVHNRFPHISYGGLCVEFLTFVLWMDSVTFSAYNAEHSFPS